MPSKKAFSTKTLSPVAMPIFPLRGAPALSTQRLTPAA